VKKSFRLLSTILVAVLILSSVAIGASANIGGLLDPNKTVVTGADIVLLGSHEKGSDDVLTYPTFNDGVSGGFSGNVTLTADVEFEAGNELAWAPVYNWQADGNTFKSKNITVSTVPGTTYEITLTVSNYDDADVNVVYTFITPAAADSAYKAGLQRLFDKAFAGSSLGYVAEVWKAFESARTNAFLVLNNSSATEADVDIAFEALESAYEDLNDENSKLSGISRYFLVIWESIKYAVWDLFLARIFSFGR